ncbi:unnamed protein product [Cercospora beticola]|nr:unnamed protein product [Cercospora beticola]
MQAPCEEVLKGCSYLSYQWGRGGRASAKTTHAWFPETCSWTLLYETIKTCSAWPQVYATLFCMRPDTIQMLTVYTGSTSGPRTGHQHRLKSAYGQSRSSYTSIRRCYPENIALLDQTL